jgi:hypothetical protein
MRANVLHGFVVWAVDMKHQTENTGSFYAYYWWLSAEGEARRRLFGVMM